MRKCKAHEGWPCEAMSINFQFKAAVVADMSESGMFKQSLTPLYQCSTNVVGMSWPVRYGEVATRAQEF